MPEITYTTGVEVEVPFSVYCDACGAGLCGQTTVKGQDVHVEPCENCIDTAVAEALEKQEEELTEQFNAELAGINDRLEVAVQKELVTNTQLEKLEERLDEFVEAAER